MSTRNENKDKVKEYNVGSPLMPSGVEHNPKTGYLELADAVGSPLMPSGVEHFAKSARYFFASIVGSPLMPSGVEHTLITMKMDQATITWEVL